MAHPAFGRLETEASQQALATLRDARARLMDLLTDGMGFSGEDATDFDRALVLSKRKAIDVAIADVERSLNSGISGQLDQAAKLAAIDLREASGFSIRVDPNVLAYAQATAGDRVTEWSSRFGAKLRGLTTQTFAGGLSYGEYVAGVRTAMGRNGAEHAVDRIVRTEINRGYQQQRAAGDDQLASIGADLIRIWVTQLDLRVRDSHAAIHGQERELTSPFCVGNGATLATPPNGRGYRCNGPLDPSLPAGELINCRCDVLYIDRAQATQPYIKKAIAAARADARVVLAAEAHVREYLAARGWSWPLAPLSR